MDTKILFTRGNLHTGSLFAVECELPFGVTEVHGPFGSELAASNYQHELAKTARPDGANPYTSLKVTRLELPHAAGTRLILHDGQNGRPDWIYG